MESEELQHSRVFIKNLIKARQVVAKKKADPGNETEEAIDRSLIVEMFCDRFGIYMYEIYRKLQIYQKALPTLGKPFPYDVMKNLESLRKSQGGRVSQEFFDELARYRFDIKNKTLLDKLIQDLDEAELDHFYIHDFHEPTLIPEERSIFENFIDLLRHFDEEESIMTFSPPHLLSTVFKDRLKDLRNITRETINNSTTAPEEIPIQIGKQKIFKSADEKIAEVDNEQPEAPAPVISSKKQELRDEWLFSETTELVSEKKEEQIPIVTFQPQSPVDIISESIGAAPEEESLSDKEMEARQQEAEQMAIAEQAFEEKEKEELSSNETILTQIMNKSMLIKETEDQVERLNTENDITNIDQKIDSSSVQPKRIPSLPQQMTPAAKARDLVFNIFNMWNTTPVPPPVPGNQIPLTIPNHLVALEVLAMFNNPSPSAGISLTAWKGMVNDFKIITSAEEKNPL